MQKMTWYFSEMKCKWMFLFYLLHLIILAKTHRKLPGRDTVTPSAGECDTEKLKEEISAFLCEVFQVAEL